MPDGWIPLYKSSQFAGSSTPGTHCALHTLRRSGACRLGLAVRNFTGDGDATALAGADGESGADGTRAKAHGAHPEAAAGRARPRQPHAIIVDRQTEAPRMHPQPNLDDMGAG